MKGCRLFFALPVRPDPEPCAMEVSAMLDRSQESVDLDRKRKDLEHLLFHPDGSRRILRFPEFVASLAP